MRWIGCSDFQNRVHLGIAISLPVCSQKVFVVALVHHYRLLERRADHLRLYSKDSKAYVMRWFPATVGVPWELEIRSTGPSSCELSCTIGVDFPNAMVKIGGLVNGFGGLFVRRHLAEETVNFARDIERKFAA